jgi:hypothetical protein
MTTRSRTAGTKQRSSVGVSDQVPTLGPTTVWAMATDELVAHGG